MKEEVLVDLYARLPYEPMVNYNNIEGCNYPLTLRTLCSFPGEKLKCYLRPVSSMTDSEMDRLFNILHADKEGDGEDWIKINEATGIKFFLPTGRWMEEMDEALSYLRSIHIDIHGFIEGGLAIEAPEWMYGQSAAKTDN